MDAPGLFYLLVRDGAVPVESLAPLLARLPGEERHVRTAVRGGEGFDATRWPIARDAALAGWIARRFDEPEVAEALAEIAAAQGEPSRLRALARRASARMVAAYGGDASLLTQLWRDATPDDLALFAEPPWSPRVAGIVAELCAAHHEAADGLYAFHVYRGLPGPAAEAAAQLARRALAEGRVDAAGLVAAALELVGPRDGVFAVTPSPAADPVVAALARACAQVREVTGAERCAIVGEHYAIPQAPGRIGFMIAAGSRALVVLGFAAAPTWTPRIAGFRARPLWTRASAAGCFELTLPAGLPEEDRAPAAVASLCFFVELSLEAHVAGHPADEAVFPILDDEALARMFA